MIHHAGATRATWRMSHRGLLLVLALLVVAVGAVEVTSFVRLVSVTAVAPLTPDQQLAHAKSAVGFQIHQPTWLPGWATLTSVHYYTRCASCPSGVNSVTLQYGSTTTGDLEIFESDGLVTFHASYEDAQGHPQPMHDTLSQITLSGAPVQVDILTGTMVNGEIREVVLSWKRDAIYYRLTSRDTPTSVADLDMVERVAASM